MSRDDTTDTGAAQTEDANDRPPPVAQNLVLLVAFLGLVAIGVFTVLLPSLEDAPPDHAGTADGGVPTAPAAPAAAAPTPPPT